VPGPIIGTASPPLDQGDANVVGVVVGRVVGAPPLLSRHAMVVVGRVVVTVAERVDLRGVDAAVVTRPVVDPADAGQGHAPFQGFQIEASEAPTST
jgi:hypothetical protein